MRRPLPPPGSPERGAWVESLRRRIARGEYSIPAELVADAVLAAWARCGPGGAGPAVGGAEAQAG
jgi:hypothetical protein